MDIFHLYKHKSIVGISGYNLSFENYYLPLHSLQTLHVQNHFRGTFYWGRILATKSDYLIAFGYQDEIFERCKYFYSIDGVFWSLMPKITESTKLLAQNCTSRMKGDPSYTIEVGDFGAEMEEYDLSIAEGTLKEEDRLAATVEMITEDAAVVPRGALYKSHDDIVIENSNFCGLNDEEARQLFNYYHFRLPRDKWNTRLINDTEVDFEIDFLDSIDKDTPEGTWTLQIEWCFMEPMAVLRNLQWPGMTFFHAINTPLHAFFYVGDGRKNMDIPFMIDFNEPPEFKKISSKPSLIGE